ncbi:threonine ammonia-lyase [Amycolatopsis cihanbeyliensis]|uniref:Threonine dehydratase n=1 Tax=Amycolatopsis cihanbeyliensis TaxID=1128664 RepID=A0A542CTB3_AMYCI|nr:pyridoxal-phosphate dependent enzyme [Amycolatopsis cihanbeyliensis]TQI94061.1 threonine dehydratase [Amycolatopsis cihanbeyliensis]
MPSTQPHRQVRVPSVADLDRAWSVVRARLRPTPLDRGDAAGELAGPALKLESLQPTGAFKVRGALSAVAALDPELPVVAASAGNHGLGVAFAARTLGRSATIVVPGNASRAKVDKLRALGIDLVEVGQSYDEAERHALDLAAAGAHFLSPYNDPEVIGGQGTIGYELAEQLDGPLTVVCGVGGGGLAAGLGLWASTRADVRVVGVEMEASTALSASVRAGRWVAVEVGPTVADGLSGNIEIDSVTIGLVSQHVDELVTVSEVELHEAMRYLAGSRGVVAEGAGAAPVAALLSGKVDARGTAVAVISGRNIALPLVAELLGAPG